MPIQDPTFRLLKDHEDPRALSRLGIEAWKHLPDTDYFVSTIGNVFNRRTGKYPAKSLGTGGYLVVGPLLVHRMVAFTFDGAREPQIVVHHLNNAKHDNCIHNLEFLTREAHASEAMTSGQLRDAGGAVVAPVPDNADAVLQAVVAGRLTQNEAAKMLGRSQGWVSLKVRGLAAVLDLSESPPLTDAERAQALRDATAGRETFWRTWPGHREWEVSNRGDVRNTRTKHVQKVRLSNNGYLKVTQAGYVHRAVMLLYGPPEPFAGALVCHYPDPNPSNSAISNLTWGSYATNAKHSQEQGLVPEGDAHERSKLTHAQVAEGLRRYMAEGWNSVDFAAFLGISQGNAYMILDGKSWESVPRPEGFRMSRRGYSDLTAEQVEAGLKLYVQNRWTQTELANHLGLKQPAVSLIVRGKTWKGVPRPPGMIKPPK